MTDVAGAVTTAFHEEWGRLVAALIGFTRDWDLAEECAQEAFTLAWRTWPRDGVPDRPGAWLLTAARHRAVDRARRARLGEVKLRQVVLDPAEPELDDSASRTTGCG